MDAGLAAVLGALAGAVATTGAAVATGWAAREQAKIAARGEHRRQRRDARQAVYEEFIELTEVLTDRVIKISDLSAPTFDQIHAAEADVWASWEGVRGVFTKVRLAGPDYVSQAAVEVRKSCTLVAVRMTAVKKCSSPDSRDPEELAGVKWVALTESLTQLIVEHGAFIGIAQVALDDDGTSK
ncbi:hypothetical protein QQY66_06340 [Streptomyces sp. DG2A-72]|uniref:hypothetical protein n=1 Tax=Streptomyces sp. DG2A-72 TaxID=3051386 RepID=UPI00265C0D09|nr:hypothetical protein [Streptomyces sp. DG2A-72]MDO0931318.1 hypothetical protein [Streptomyces sp. DG2A-72]